jgi:hypothetical protein
MVLIEDDPMLESLTSAFGSAGNFVHEVLARRQQPRSSHGIV